MLPEPPAAAALWLVVCWLAVWRTTALVCYDSGPFDLLTRLRRGLAAAGLHRLVTCFHCTAIWVSLVVVVAVYGARWSSLLFVLALAGAASMTERWLGGAGTEWREEAVDG